VCVRVCAFGICNNGVDITVKSFEYDRGLHEIGLKMFGTPNRVALMIDEYNILYSSHSLYII